ncbi:MAG: orotidine-5'-phosphate decarboxylase [Bradyrhizobiaceae bacterium]|nr:orotidine-5'-phosphate decarboxylase [Bradyrhizobiaceae bacterium]
MDVHGLCVGLDPDLKRMPKEFASVSSIVEYMRLVVDVTQHVAKAYKINTAFFEQYGLDGYRALFETREIVGNRFCVIDAKRADIGNTSAAYARCLFDELRADAVTVAPYMGSDSVSPFLDRGLTYLLALTSNPGSADFQRQHIGGGNHTLYETVIETAMGWKGASPIGFVVGATHPGELAHVRTLVPNAPLLIPGIGAQGADARTTAEANGDGPALFNVGRAILYANTKADSGESIRDAAEQFARDLSR